MEGAAALPRAARCTAGNGIRAATGGIAPPVVPDPGWGPGAGRGEVMAGGTGSPSPGLGRVPSGGAGGAASTGLGRVSSGGAESGGAGRAVSGTAGGAAVESAAAAVPPREV
ncbi:MAG TPA: hypothetical protein VGD11_17820 [Mycobacteriales bacterium]